MPCPTRREICSTDFPSMVCMMNPVANPDLFGREILFHPCDHRPAIQQAHVDADLPALPGYRLDGWPYIRRSHANMGDLQLPQHLVENPVILIIISGCENERFVLHMDRIPIQPSEIGIEIGLVDRAPDFLKTCKYSLSC